MTKYLRSKNIWVRTVTNASLLHKSDFFKKLIDPEMNDDEVLYMFDKMRDFF